MQKSYCGKPSNPQYDLMQILHIDDAKYKDEFVEYKIPKFILHVL
jgi:hypothetical protein